MSDERYARTPLRVLFIDDSMPATRSPGSRSKSRLTGPTWIWYNSKRGVYIYLYRVCGYNTGGLMYETGVFYSR